MANIKSSMKDIRRIAKRTAHNRHVRTRLKTLQKNFKDAAGKENPEAVKEAARAYVSALDKAAKRRIIHPNRASRHKSECAAAQK